jgi:hypothetical protein
MSSVLNPERVIATAALVLQAMSNSEDILNHDCTIRIMAHYLISNIMLSGKAIQSIIAPGKSSAVLLAVALAYNLYMRVLVAKRPRVR